MADPFGKPVVGDCLYEDGRCKLCGRHCPSLIAKDNHARKHQREGAVAIKGWGGPDGARRFEIVNPFAASSDIGGEL